MSTRHVTTAETLAMEIRDLLELDTDLWVDCSEVVSANAGDARSRFFVDTGKGQVFTVAISFHAETTTKV